MTSDMSRPARRTMTLPRSTWMIIIISVGSAVVVSVFVLSLWLCLRHRRKQSQKKPQYQYKKLQKRSRDTSPNPKHLSLSTNTDETGSHRTSTSSAHIPRFQTQDHKSQPDLEAQILFGMSSQAQLDSLQIPQRCPSQTSTYSWRPEHLAKGSFAQTIQGPRLVPSTVLLSRPVSFSAAETRRTPSTRIANYHSQAEYVDLINHDINELLTDTGETPAVPERPSRRSRSVSKSRTRPEYERLQIVELGENRGPVTKAMLR